VIRPDRHRLCTRSALAIVLGLMLATRLLVPAGFMPEFGNGTLSIVSCPDAGPAAGGHYSHHGQPKKTHSPCPYAAGATAASLADADPQLLIALFGAALLAWRTFVFLQRSSSRERPPARGPPIPA
jgi:hypothetical protein